MEAENPAGPRAAAPDDERGMEQGDVEESKAAEEFKALEDSDFCMKVTAKRTRSLSQKELERPDKAIEGYRRSRTEKVQVK